MTRRVLRRAVVLLLGRPIVCRRCGRRITHAFAIARRGRIWTPGLHRATVRVVFTETDELAFEHVDSGECAAA